MRKACPHAPRGAHVRRPLPAAILEGPALRTRQLPELLVLGVLLLDRPGVGGLRAVVQHRTPQSFLDRLPASGKLSERSADLGRTTVRQTRLPSLRHLAGRMEVELGGALDTEVLPPPEGRASQLHESERRATLASGHLRGPGLDIGLGAKPDSPAPQETEATPLPSRRSRRSAAQTAAKACRRGA